MKKMNKKAIAFETVVTAAIVLIVLAVVIFIFYKLYSGSACTAEDYVKMQSTDTDKDGVVDSVDQCCNSPDITNINSFGCGPDSSSDPRIRCTPKGCKEEG